MQVEQASKILHQQHQQALLDAVQRGEVSRDQLIDASPYLRDCRDNNKFDQCADLNTLTAEQLTAVAVLAKKSDILGALTDDVLTLADLVEGEAHCAKLVGRVQQYDAFLKVVADNYFHPDEGFLAELEQFGLSVYAAACVSMRAVLLVDDAELRDRFVQVMSQLYVLANAQSERFPSHKKTIQTSLAYALSDVFTRLDNKTLKLNDLDKMLQQQVLLFSEPCLQLLDHGNVLPGDMMLGVDGCNAVDYHLSGSQVEDLVLAYCNPEEQYKVELLCASRKQQVLQDLMQRINAKIDAQSRFSVRVTASSVLRLQGLRAKLEQCGARAMFDYKLEQSGDRLRFECHQPGRKILGDPVESINTVFANCHEAIKQMHLPYLMHGLLAPFKAHCAVLGNREAATTHVAGFGEQKGV